MKIVTRDELLKRYNKKYKNIIHDPEERLKQYFLEHGLNFDKAVIKAKEKLEDLASSVEYKYIKITLYEYPMKTDRPRQGKFGVYSPNAKANKKYLTQSIKGIKKTLKLINTPAKITIDAYMEMPESMPADEIILYEAKILKVLTTPDYDNIGKCYTDMLKDNIIIDDDIFHEGLVRKYYSTLPRVEILIAYQTAHDSDHIYKKMKQRKSIKLALKEGLIELEKYH